MQLTPALSARTCEWREMSERRHRRELWRAAKAVRRIVVIPGRRENPELCDGSRPA